MPTKQDKNMPTLADIAKIAGVGIMSVSRVVNGSRRVTPEVERKVRAAIKKIGYEPNEAARILKGHRSRVLGLIVPDLADPFFATCANAIQETALETGYMTLISACGHSEDVERQQARIMMQRHVAGLLVIASGTRNDHFLAARNAGIPIVALDRPLRHVESDTLIVDNRAASARMTEHLIKHGHSHILCIANDDKVFTTRERIVGYSQAVRQAKSRVQVCLADPIHGLSAGQLESALRSNPSLTAIFATSNVLAVQVIRELQRRSVRIPEEMALAAFDDFDAATLVRPTITVIRQPNAELGRQATKLLLARLRNSTPIEPLKLVLQTELVIRQSCGCKKQQTTS
jgi:LacI family transcriptional regulator